MFLSKQKGEEYECEDCGLVVLVETPCDCENPCLVCCGEPMKPVKATSAPEKKQAAKPKKA